ncbi:hypothetical protein AOQ84DRAFT_379720 [Glonium stellatum]|uniref:Uncharacterized protein n=1 Tax=Glonium stellatum TaxID=574774 RepID=A0A8E2EUX2_9PEZI|nr:hypothetical protein AOQ84DRAFT_379720 [Glonium stellatum]
MGSFVAATPKTLAYFRGNTTTQIPKVPTIGNLIQAGDRLMFTSALFDHIHPSPQDVCWVGLYTQFFREMAWLSPKQTHDARKNEAIARYLDKADADNQKLHDLPDEPTTSIRRNVKSETPYNDLEKGLAHGYQTTPVRPNSEIPIRCHMFAGRSKGPALLVSCIQPLENIDSENNTSDEQLSLTQ